MALQCLLGALLAISPYVGAQYQQDYIKQTNAGVDQYFFQPKQNDVPIQVVDLGPNQVVTLVYNCFYMRDICKNAYNFQHFSRGQNLHPRSGLGNDVFGYDFNGRGGRRDARRDKSCPDNWKDSHRCPEADQRAIMRQDGQWFTNALEPDTTINQIMDLPSDPVQYSGLRYTCDEFPPATWVEGGAGENNDSFAETRCAAFRCMAGYKGEQNWQALAHSGLRRELFRLVKQRNAVNSEFSRSRRKSDH